MLYVQSLQQPHLQNVGQQNFQPSGTENPGGQVQYQQPEARMAPQFAGNPQEASGPNMQYIQPQGRFSQQMPQVGVDYHNLAYLAQRGDHAQGYPAHDFEQDGVGFHAQAFSGHGMPHPDMALPLQMPHMPQYTHFNLIGR